MNIREYIQNSINTKKTLLENDVFIEKLKTVSEEIINAYKNGKKVLTAGNGGSAADAQHIAGELVVRFFFDRPGLNAYSLTTDASVFTAASNDYGYETSFSRQIEAMGKEGDIFIAISTSGNSENIVKAIESANKNGLVTIGLVGEKPSKMDSLCKYTLKVPSEITPIIQESQIMIGHILCGMVEEGLFGNKS